MRVIVAIIFWTITAAAVPSAFGRMSDNNGRRLPITYITEFATIGHSGEFSTERLDKHLQSLHHKFNDTHDTKFLSFLFNKTHQKFLKNYSEGASFYKLVEKGAYNCLTATALYAILLDEFGFEYEVIETNYHIFLLVATTEGTVLLETTDPVFGFVADEKAIGERLGAYSQNVLEDTDQEKTFYQYAASLFNKVTLDELRGLLYYNQAVKSYNERKFVEAVTYLEHAAKHYSSERIIEFANLVLFSIQTDASMSSASRKQTIDTLKKISKYNSRIVAGLKSL